VHGTELESRRQDGTPLWLSVWQQRIICSGQECHLTILLDVTQHRLDQLELQQLLKLSDNDREMIAFEIHDGVVQEMTGALIHLEAAQQAIEKGKPDGFDQLQTVMQILRDGIREARQLMAGVRSPELEQAGLCGALQGLIDKLSATSGIAIEFVHAVAFERLTGKWEDAVYRIVQESLNNVRRHSKSRGRAWP